MTIRRLAQLPDLELVHARSTRPYPSHVASDIKIALVMRGGKRYDHRGRTHLAAEGSLVFAEVGETHGGRPAGDRLDVVMLSVGPILLAGLLCDDSRPPSGGWRFDSVVSDRRLARAFMQVCQPMLNGERTPLVVEERLSEFAGLLARDAPVVGRSTRQAGERVGVERARHVLHAAFTGALSLRELAEAARLPQPRFLREFRREIGMPPHAYQVHLRVDHAKTLIARGTALVDVAASCGFFDQSHLHRHFQRIVGISPGRYRSAIE